MEVVDLRSLSPLDEATVLTSVRKTGALITADEGCLRGNLGGELAAVVCDQAVDSLHVVFRQCRDGIKRDGFGRFFGDLHSCRDNA